MHTNQGSRRARALRMTSWRAVLQAQGLGSRFPFDLCPRRLSAACFSLAATEAYVNMPMKVWRAISMEWLESAAEFC